MDYTEHIVELETRRIAPPHEVRDADKLAAIVESMRDDGWKGRPLLAVDYGDGDAVALTASHRWAAAREVELAEVPVVLVPQCERLTIEHGPYGPEVHFDGDRLIDDEDRLSALVALGYDVAATLMNEEFEAA